MIQIGKKPGHRGLTRYHYEKSQEISDDLKRFALLFVKDLHETAKTLKNTLIFINHLNTSMVENTFLSILTKNVRL